MRKWIFPTQQNITVVGMTYVCLFVMVGTTVEAQETTSQTEPPAYASTDTVFPIFGEDVERCVRFQGLAAQWLVERGASSSIKEICTTPAYLQIMARGPDIIPLIINQLRAEGDNPDHWFFALHYLTNGFDPVPEQDKGDMLKMANAWLEWADHEGYAG